VTEHEWQKTTVPDLLMREVQASRSERKSRLVSVAIARRAAWAECDPQFRHALDVAERHADGKADVSEVESAISGADSSGVMFATNLLKNLFKPVPQWVSKLTASGVAHFAVPESERVSDEDGVEIPGEYSPEGEVVYRTARACELIEHCRLVREVFGNPFRPVGIEPSWLTSTVLAMARELYESRDFVAMPILGDALQDAGCDCDDLLNHLRGNGPHHRGCWALDLFVGKS